MCGFDCIEFDTEGFGVITIAELKKTKNLLFFLLPDKDAVLPCVA